MHPLRLLDCLKNPSCRLALIFLHTELTGDEVTKNRGKFEMLWKNAVFKCSADSGCNFLHEHFSSVGRGWIPDLVCGDFDSVKENVLDFFRSRSDVRVVYTPDQDETDFTKALRLVAEEITTKNHNVDMIVAVCSGKGRFDHNMGNINTLFNATKIHASLLNIPVILMSECDMQYVIPGSSKQELLLDTGLEGPNCGVIPLRGPSTVTTSGLRWNLEGQRLEFGGLISTSNEIMAASVTIDSDLPILWTMSVKDVG